jgi:hypothetical protein
MPQPPKKIPGINIDAESFTLSNPASSWQQWKDQKSRHYTTSKFYKPLHKFLLALYAFAQFIFIPFFFTALFLQLESFFDHIQH